MIIQQRVLEKTHRQDFLFSGLCDRDLVTSDRKLLYAQLDFMLILPAKFYDIKQGV
jgi:hypothetical protein